MPFVGRGQHTTLNPYDATVDDESTADPDLNMFGGVVFSFGLLALAPVAMFSLLILIAAIVAVANGGLRLASHPRAIWGIGIAVSFVAFVLMSFRMTRSTARMAMYVLGSATVFCSVIYDTYNVVELNANTGACGNPVAVGQAFRLSLIHISEPTRPY